MVTQSVVKSDLKPLCVDLDGTLVRTDLLIESVFALLKKNVLYAFLLPLWLLRGKAYLKQEIADRVDIDPATLPYHQDFAKYLQEQYSIGRKLILATASNKKLAQQVSRHLGIFDSVLASDERVNLSGQEKLARLEREFGKDGFDYAGNAKADLPLWTRVGRAIVVNPRQSVKHAVERQGISVLTFDDQDGRSPKDYFEAARLHQWLKNFLVFVPLLMSHRFMEPVLVGQAIVAFFSFGLCASSVYLLNDLLDLPDDRRHPTKQNRVLSAGRIPIIHGVILIPVLLTAAFGLALFLPVEFLLTLAGYYVITLAYSLILKRKLLVDVLALASLYTIRIIAGAAATLIAPSFWLLAFSMFLFFSLALVKRFTELSGLHQRGEIRPGGRGYRTVDLESLSQFGSASAFMAVLVLALYINSNSVRQLYSYPELIWLLCPLLLYMLGRIWFLARRGELHEDPVVFVMKDRRSQYLIGMFAMILWFAI